MKSYMNRFVLIFLTCLPLMGTAQSVWEERFDGLANNTTNDYGATAWTTQQPTGSTAYSMFQTTSFNDGSGNITAFVVNDTGNEGVWRSEVIDISSYAEVSIAALLGQYWASNTDYIRAYYMLDGASEVQFGEQYGEPAYTSTSAASAIVMGTSLQIVFRAYENTTTFYSGFPRIMGFDDIVISEINYLYSRQSGNWNSGSTWSAGGYNGASCGCTPNSDTRVFVGNNRTVNINTNVQTAGLTIENTGLLRFTNNYQLDVVKGGAFVVDAGGTLDKNGNNSSVLNFSAYDYNPVVNGTVSVGIVNVDAASWSLSGTGDFTINKDLSFLNMNGQLISNSLTGTFTIGDELVFPASSADFTFVNAGTLNITNRIRFYNTGVSLENSGTITTGTNGILVSANSDDGNSISNSGVLNFANINLNNADFTLNNSGTVNQTGTFSNVGAGSSLNNSTGGNWNYSGNSTTNRFDASAANNTVNFSRTGSQTIFIPSNGYYINLTISGTGTKTASGNLDINGNLSMSIAALDMSNNNYSLNLTGNWTVGSAGDLFVERAGTVIFDGAADQSLQTISGAETYNNCIINKSGGSVAPGATNINITNTLSLLAGVLNLSGSTLNITNSSSAAVTRTTGCVISGTNASSIIWSVGSATGSYVFPFGKSDVEYIPFTFNITSAGIGAGTVSVATYGTGTDNTPYPAGVTKLGTQSGTDVVDRFWQIDVNGYIINPTATVTFTATAGEVGGLSAMKAQRWNSTDSAWDPALDGQSNPTAYAVTVPGVNTFSPWTLVDGSTTLPVELLYFNAWLDNDVVKVEWKTAQEINNDYFTLEKTQDFESFYEVQVIKGQGSSNKEHVYTVVDNYPMTGTSYYRLKQTDFDGAFEFFDPVRITNESKRLQFSLYPNPSSGQRINLKFAGTYNGQIIPVRIYNSSGALVHSESRTMSTGTMGSFQLEMSAQLAPGFYMVKIAEIYSQKLMVKK